MHGSANDTKSLNFSLCAQTQREPVLAKKAGHIVSPISFAEQHQATCAARKKVFETEFGDWLASQNARFEAIGIPGADLRLW